METAKSININLLNIPMPKGHLTLDLFNIFMMFVQQKNAPEICDYVMVLDLKLKIVIFIIT